MLGIPSTVDMEAVGIAAAAALILGLAGGVSVTRAVYVPRLELAKQQLTALGVQIKEQNTAIDGLVAADKQRAAYAAKAVAEAAGKAKVAELRAQAILRRQKPVGVDDCTAASDLISQELAK